MANLLGNGELMDEHFERAPDPRARNTAGRDILVVYLRRRRNQYEFLLSISKLKEQATAEAQFDELGSRGTEKYS